MNTLQTVYVKKYRWKIAVLPAGQCFGFTGWLQSGYFAKAAGFLVDPVSLTPDWQDPVKTKLVLTSQKDLIDLLADETIAAGIYDRETYRFHLYFGRGQIRSELSWPTPVTSLEKPGPDWLERFLDLGIPRFVLMLKPDGAEFSKFMEGLICPDKDFSQTMSLTENQKLQRHLMRKLLISNSSSSSGP